MGRRVIDDGKRGEEPEMGRRVAAASYVPVRRSFVLTSRSRPGASPVRAVGRSGACVHGCRASLAAVIWAQPATVPPGPMAGSPSWFGHLRRSPPWIEEPYATCNLLYMLS
jgi:hypothetical protein